MVECDSRRPEMRFEIDRFGVGLFSLSSARPPIEDLDSFLASFGELSGLSMLAEPEARRIGIGGSRGELLLIPGDIAVCDVRLAEEGRDPGVRGADDIVPAVSLATEICLIASETCVVSKARPSVFVVGCHAVGSVDEAVEDMTARKNP